MAVEKVVSPISTAVHGSFGEWLKQRRRAAGLTQDELADVLACSTITLKKIEAGERRASRQIALLLAAHFQIPADEHEAFVTFARSELGATTYAARPPVVVASAASPGTTPLAPTIPVPAHGPPRAPWRAAQLRQSNLPQPLTDLIGREPEERAVRALLLQPRVRLLTLTGAPGIGKTRLCLAVAAHADVAAHFGEGVCLVELAPVTDPGMVLPAIARALGVQESRGAQEPLTAQLRQFLADKRLLLVLDNFEQVLDAASDVVQLIQGSPWLKVLVTSREALHVRGERRFPVPPLPVPSLAGPLDLEALGRNPAVALFVTRAQEAQARFALSAANAADVVAVCAGLDGLPLAIELAAARATMLSAGQMRAALSSRLKLATQGWRDLPARQQTLRAAIDWSYALLDAGEQQLFRRLAVFGGGCTLDAVEDVCNADSSLPGDLLSGVESLLSKNLVQQRAGAQGAPRFMMLATIDEYAGERLQESGEEDDLRQHHLAYFMALAEEAAPHWMSNQTVEWLSRLEDEHDNMRAALQWVRQASSPATPGPAPGTAQGVASRAAGAEVADANLERGLRLAAALRWFWEVRGYRSEGRAHVLGILAVSECGSGSTRPASGMHSSGPAPVGLRAARAKALNAAGDLLWNMGDLATGGARHQESLAIWRELGDPTGIAWSLVSLGWVARFQGEYATARELLEEGRTIREALADYWGVAIALVGLGQVAWKVGDATRARAHLERSLAIQRGLGDKWGSALSLTSLGYVAVTEGDDAAARALLEQSLALYRELGDKHMIMGPLTSLGEVTHRQGDTAQATALYREGLTITQAPNGIGVCLWALAGLAGTNRQPQRAARLLGAAASRLEAGNADLDSPERSVYEQGLASVRAQLDEEAFVAAWAAGQAMTLEQAIAYALEVDG